MEIVTNSNIIFTWNQNAEWTEKGWIKGLRGYGQYGQYGRTNHNFEGYCENKTCLTCLDSKGSDPNYEKIIEKVPIPSSLWFFIKVNNKDDYELVKDFLNKFDTNDHNTEIYIPDITKQHGTTKPEYQKLIEQIDQLNEQIEITNNELRVKTEEIYIKHQQEYNQKYNVLTNNNNNLCDHNHYVECYDLNIFGYKYPEYIYEMYDDYNVTFEICARKGSKFYNDFLIKYQLIEKYWPANIDKEIITYIPK